MFYIILFIFFIKCIKLTCDNNQYMSYSAIGWSLKCYKCQYNKKPTKSFGAKSCADDHFDADTKVVECDPGQACLVRSKINILYSVYFLLMNSYLIKDWTFKPCLPGKIALRQVLRKRSTPMKPLLSSNFFSQ